MFWVESLFAAAGIATQFSSISRSNPKTREALFLTMAGKQEMVEVAAFDFPWEGERAALGKTGSWGYRRVHPTLQ
jgi:hypothetical protein